MQEDIKKYIKKAEILIEALPYIQKFNNKTIVIKYGGNAMVSDELKNKVMEDVVLLKYIGMNPILVHGGGPDITGALKKFGKESTFMNGLRVTDSETMEIAQMVLVGKTNKEIVSILCGKGGSAIGLCGLDGSLIECRKHMPEIDGKPTDIGYVGEIVGINIGLLDMLTKSECIPVIAPIGVDSEGQSYNINADTVAGMVASALEAEKLMLLTDIDGIKTSLDSDEIIYHIDKKGILKLIDEGVISGGMIPKALGGIKAIDAGVNSVHIIDGRIPHCLLLEIFTKSGIGTMITR